MRIKEIHYRRLHFAQRKLQLAVKMQWMVWLDALLREVSATGRERRSRMNEWRWDEKKKKAREYHFVAQSMRQATFPLRLPPPTVSNAGEFISVLEGCVWNKRKQPERIKCTTLCYCCSCSDCILYILYVTLGSWRSQPHFLLLLILTSNASRIFIWVKTGTTQTPPYEVVTLRRHKKSRSQRKEKNRNTGLCNNISRRVKCILLQGSWWLWWWRDVHSKAERPVLLLHNFRKCTQTHSHLMLMVKRQNVANKQRQDQ